MLLSEAAGELENNLNEYPNEPEQIDTDEENGSECPIFDRFYESGGSSAIESMINFDPAEFEIIWNTRIDFIATN